MPIPDAGSRRRIGWTIAALALITGVLGILAVLAPLTADDPVVSWPRAGQQPTSTVLTLSPYRPLQLTATVHIPVQRHREPVLHQPVRDTGLGCRRTSLCRPSRTRQPTLTGEPYIG